jgi:hypothetical protein
MVNILLYLNLKGERNTLKFRRITISLLILNLTKKLLAKFMNGNFRKRENYKRELLEIFGKRKFKIYKRELLGIFRNLDSSDGE